VWFALLPFFLCKLLLKKISIIKLLEKLHEENVILLKDQALQTQEREKEEE